MTHAIHQCSPNYCSHPSSSLGSNFYRSWNASSKGFYNLSVLDCFSKPTSVVIILFVEWEKATYPNTHLSKNSVILPPMSPCIIIRFESLTPRPLIYLCFIILQLIQFLRFPVFIYYPLLHRSESSKWWIKFSLRCLILEGTDLLSKLICEAWNFSLGSLVILSTQPIISF